MEVKEYKLRKEGNSALANYQFKSTPEGIIKFVVDHMDEYASDVEKYFLSGIPTGGAVGVHENGVCMRISRMGEPNKGLEEQVGLYIFDDGVIAYVEERATLWSTHDRVNLGNNYEAIGKMQAKLGRGYYKLEGLFNKSKNRRLAELCKSKVITLIGGMKQQLEEEQKKGRTL